MGRRITRQEYARRRAERSMTVTNSVIHPEHGAYEFEVCALESPSGVVTLLVFTGALRADAAKVKEMVRGVMSEFGSKAIHLPDSYDSTNLALWLAAWFKAHPDSDTFIVPGSEWGIGASE